MRSIISLVFFLSTSITDFYNVKRGSSPNEINLT